MICLMNLEIFWSEIMIDGSQPPLGGYFYKYKNFFPFADDGAPKRAEYAIRRSRIPTFDIFILIYIFSFIIRRLQPTKKPNQTKGLRAWRKINNIKYGLKMFKLQNVIILLYFVNLNMYNVSIN